MDLTSTSGQKVSLLKSTGHPCMALRLRKIVSGFIRKFAISFNPFLCVTFHVIGHDLGHLLRGRRIQMSGHSDIGFFLR